MKIGIGIDTGGTYTDAVLYDFETKTVLSKAKSLTTKEDLTKGIGGALDGLDCSLFADVKIVALSTTLATNACVEEKGGRAKLIFFGVKESVVDEVGESYGLAKKEDLRFYDKKTASSSDTSDIDWDLFLSGLEEWISDVDGIGIVELFAMNNGAAYERKARECIEENYHLPVICGHQLFSDLNSIQRGASTMLNAKLIPVISEFLKAVKKSLAERKILAPLVIVRSDGTLMSEESSYRRPVETILCGPAASVLGSMHEADVKDGIIVDMGGTTTDISLIKENKPVTVQDGISIGNWKTFVKGVFIDTIALGGDSTVRVKGKQLYLETRRSIPYCVAATQYPEIKDDLRALIASGEESNFPLQEFFLLLKDITNDERYTERERAFCKGLEKRPLIFRKAINVVADDFYTFSPERLEQEGVVTRIGLTPTDMMHIKGDFNVFDAEASHLAATYFARILRLKSKNAEEIIAEQVYDLVKKSLFCDIVRILVEDKFHSVKKEGMSLQIQEMIELAWQEWKEGKKTDFAKACFSTNATLIGIGAPIHIFLPEVAEALQAPCLIPDNAEVANAIGAVVGNISATSCVKFEPYTEEEEDVFVVYGETERVYLHGLEAAREKAIEMAKKQAEQEAIVRGVVGDITIKVEVQRIVGAVASGGDGIDLGTEVYATAVGGAML